MDVALALAWGAVVVWVGRAQAPSLAFPLQREGGVGEVQALGGEAWR